MTTEKKHSNRPLWALIAVTVLPFTAAWIVYLNPSLLGDLKTTNRGELVTPPRPVPELSLETLSGDVFDTADLANNWTLLTVAASACDRDCELNLYHMRQIRLAMGEARQRIQRVLVLEDTAAADALRKRLEPYEGTVVITGPASARDRFLALLTPDGDSPASNRIYLIDPQGFLMMTYPPAPPAGDVVKDLQRLLRVVQL